MNAAWAIRLALENAGALASLRLVPGVEVCVADATVWARARHLDEVLDMAIRGLPVEARYLWLEEDLLLEAGRRIPSESLPLLPWINIADWVVPKLPPTTPASQTPTPVSLSLKRCSIESPSHLLLANVSDWEAYACTACELRLSRLSFAINDRGQALIRGTPLPPLPGQRWTDVEGVGVPLGFVWHPYISATSLARVWGTSPHRLVLWHPDGHAEWIQSEQFVPANRSNVRASCRDRQRAP
jgi:hypothetical protein